MLVIARSRRGSERDALGSRPVAARGALRGTSFDVLSVPCRDLLVLGCGCARREDRCRDRERRRRRGVLSASGRERAHGARRPAGNHHVGVEHRHGHLLSCGVITIAHRRHADQVGFATRVFVVGSAGGNGRAFACRRKLGQAERQQPGDRDEHGCAEQGDGQTAPQVEQARQQRADEAAGGVGRVVEADVDGSRRRHRRTPGSGTSATTSSGRTRHRTRAVRRRSRRSCRCRRQRDTDCSGDDRRHDAERERPLPGGGDLVGYRAGTRGATDWIIP